MNSRPNPKSRIGILEFRNNLGTFSGSIDHGKDIITP
jgi:hypothetical protein